MKLLKHLATFGGLYLAAGLLYWILAFWAIPMTIMHESGWIYWHAVLASHGTLAFFAWLVYGGMKS